MAPLLGCRAAPGQAQSAVIYGADGLGDANRTPTDAAVLGAGNLRVFARTPPEYKEKHCFLHASKEDRRGPVGDVRLARAAECIDCIAAADCRSDTPLAARRLSVGTAMGSVAALHSVI